MKKWIKENKLSIIIWIIFEIVAISLFIFTKKIFYIFNFSYIGTCIAIGIYFMSNGKKYAKILYNLE